MTEIFLLTNPSYKPIIHIRKVGIYYTLLVEEECS